MCSGMPTCRILVVEDYEPFRRVIRSILKEHGEFVIISETSDGLEAIRRAEQFQPDVVLLDIGLPVLNGIEAAKGISSVAPQTKILFVSQESSPEIIRETFRAGGRAYVHKARVAGDLVLAIKVVLSGKQFVGGAPGLQGPVEAPAPRHEILFCPDDDAFVDGLSEFIVAALRANKVAISVVAEARQEALLQRLHALHVDVQAAMEQGNYLPVNPDDLLSMFMVDGRPDEDRFWAAADFIIRTAAERTPGERRQIVACGECAPALWRQDKIEATIQLEHLLDKLAISRQIDILCVYPSSNGRENDHALKSLWEEHTTVYSQ